MATIDEIMTLVEHYANCYLCAESKFAGDDDYQERNETRIDLHETIKAAIADAWVAGALSSKVTLGEAERRGAEQMREAAASAGFDAAFSDENACEVMKAICALPLPNESKL